MLELFICNWLSTSPSSESDTQSAQVSGDPLQTSCKAFRTNVIQALQHTDQYSFHLRTAPPRTWLAAFLALQDRCMELTHQTFAAHLGDLLLLCQHLALFLLFAFW